MVYNDEDIFGHNTRLPISGGDQTSFGEIPRQDIIQKEANLNERNITKFTVGALLSVTYPVNQDNTLRTDWNNNTYVARYSHH